MNISRLLIFTLFLNVSLFADARPNTTSPTLEQQEINPISTPSSNPHLYFNTEDPIEDYFKNFESLSKLEKWDNIITQGSAALEIARNFHRHREEAKIYAQLTSTAFYMGDYTQALLYANHCHELSELFDDPSLLIRAIYLESAAHRALAGKEEQEETQQYFYLRAVEICEEAAVIYSKTAITNVNLKGKVYFNLGAAYADNPKGNIEKANNCYSIALDCFKHTNATDDVVRTSIRLGKIYLLQKNHLLCQQMLDEVRPLIVTERLSMHADYLEAQLKLAQNDLEAAFSIATVGLEKAKKLGAKEDELRLYQTLNLLKSS